MFCPGCIDKKRGSASLVLQACNAFDFEKDILRESCHLDRRSGRFVVTKEVSINSVHSDEIIHVLQEYGSLHDTANVAAAGFQDRLEVCEGLRGLFDDPTIDDLHGGGNERDATREKDEVPSLDGL